MGTERECIRWIKVGKGRGRVRKGWGRKGVGRRGWKGWRVEGVEGCMTEG